MPATELTDFGQLDEYYEVQNLRPGGDTFKFVTETEAEAFLAERRALAPDPTFWANFHVIRAN